ncbi:class I SAM-dependent methyltransferase [Streptomyces sp. NPDC048636]|uniref:class I SAM-dependent methyltransferase n=1 Tax=Streptomyces sp. NPDC048636 TaxID=3155762 RepID=UPI00344A4EC7
MDHDISEERLLAMDSTAGYGDAAEALAEQYESVTFTEVHRDVLHLLPTDPASVLDIGAGSGRDAAALAERGHRVVAVEPTAELRALGRHIHAGADIEWIDDALPGLPGVRARDRRFDLILLTAVWMHLDRSQRTAGMAGLAGLLAAGGRMMLSLRHGPVPAGRRMFPVSAEETVALAEEHGLEVLHLAHREDAHGREGVSWTYLGLRHASLSFRRADERDLPALVGLRDEAARWQLAHGIDQWKPGELGTEHFRARLREGEVWIATLGRQGPIAGAWELWWDDPAAWGPQRPDAGYVHRLMTDRRVAPPGTGQRMLAEAEARIAATGRTFCRLDCLAGNSRLREYYETAGYKVMGERSKDGGLGHIYPVTLLEKPL